MKAFGLVMLGKESNVDICVLFMRRKKANMLLPKSFIWLPPKRFILVAFEEVCQVASEEVC